MAEVFPFPGIRFSPEHVRLGGVLAPPYDVISDAQRDHLYGRDLRNIVRVDFGAEFADDQAGHNDRYTRAADFLRSWLDLGILVRDPRDAFYVADHEFVHPDGSHRHRRGILATVPAVPWEASQLRPHERTMSGPKQDRLALMGATHVQTSPVFALWSDAPAMAEALDGITAEPPLLGGRTDGELGSEKHLVWQTDDPALLQAVREALRPARLYVADGHHRYETSVAYAAERRAGEPDAPPDAPFERCLVYLAAGDDPDLVILPTHRLVSRRPGMAFSLDDLWARLDDSWELERSAGAEEALAAGAELRRTHNAFAVVAPDGAGLLKRPRLTGVSPRKALDVSVLEADVLAPAGITAEAIEAGALSYTRDASALAEAVRSGRAVLGFGLQPVTPAEVIAVADAQETMPQKSTYFYPKVPTGLVLHDVG